MEQPEPENATDTVDMDEFWDDIEFSHIMRGFTKGEFVIITPKTEIICIVLMMKTVHN